MPHDPLPLGPRLIGQTEKTLNAILDHYLADSGVSETEWVALMVTSQRGTAPEATAAERVASAIKRSPADGAAALASLAARGFVTPDGDGERVAVTAEGRRFQEGVQRRTAALGDRLWGPIAPADRETAASVLNVVLERATEELASLREEAVRA